MVPEGLWSSAKFFTRIVEAYQSENVESLEREEAMGKVVYLLAKHSVTMGYFEITVIVLHCKLTYSHRRLHVLLILKTGLWL